MAGIIDGFGYLTGYCFLICIAAMVLREVFDAFKGGW